MSTEPDHHEEPHGREAERNIAWARALARAFDDAQFYRRLKTNPHGVLRDYGFDVTAQTMAELQPTLEELDEAIAWTDKHRAIANPTQASAAQSFHAVPTSIIAPIQVAQPVIGAASVVAPQPAMPSYPVSSAAAVSPYNLGAYAARPSAPMLTFVGPSPYGSQFCFVTALASIAASQVATTRAGAQSGAATPQRFGGPPSGGVLASA